MYKKYATCNRFSIPYLVMHLLTQPLQLNPRVLQRFLLNVIRRRVGEQLVESDDVARDLEYHVTLNLTRRDRVFVINVTGCSPVSLGK